jgi:two-component system, NarL family, response regulator LiaR
MKQETAVSVVIVDDHGVVRQGVRAYLDTQSDVVVVGEAPDGEAGVALCAEHAPDVALVDLVMPGLDGVATTRGIKAASPRTQVIILTSFDEDSQALPAIEAGAISYLLKDVSGEALAEAVRKAAAGEPVLHPRVASRLVDALRNRPPRSQDALATLSQREREVLNLLAQGLSNSVIAEQLAIGEKTVKSHVSNILGKLHVADRTQAAVYAWRRGVVRDEPAR